MNINQKYELEGNKAEDLLCLGDWARRTFILVTASSTMCFLRRFRRLRPPSSSTSTDPRNCSLKTVVGPLDPTEPLIGASFGWAPTVCVSGWPPPEALPISSSLESQSSSSRLPCDVTLQRPYPWVPP